MGRELHIFYKSIAVIFIMAMLFSCQGRIDKVRQMNKENLGPQTEEKGVNFVYTDSGRVTAKIRSKQMLDYGLIDFPYREFPQGVEVEFYDDSNKKNTVFADYAIIYNKTNLVDLRGHVKIITGDSTVLKSKQLYWDRDRKWVFTDLDYTIEMTNGTVNNGQGFDSNEKFSNFISRSNFGTHQIEDQEQ